MKAHMIVDEFDNTVNAENEIKPLPFTPDPWAVRELQLFADMTKIKAEKNAAFGQMQAKYEQNQAAIASDVYNFARARSGDKDVLGFTTDIIHRLLKGLPLTPIEDKEDEWAMDERFPDEETQYHKRRPCLWRTRCGEDKDGGAIYTYTDNKRVQCVDNKGKFHMKLVTDILDDIEPIQFPYMPATEPILVFAESFFYEFATKGTDGGTKYNERKPDTYGFFSYLLPNGRVKKLDRYFTKKEGKFTEIPYSEYVTMRAEFNEAVEAALLRDKVKEDKKE